MKAFFLDLANLVRPFLFRTEDERKPIGEVSSSNTCGKTKITEAILRHIILAVRINQTAEGFFAAGR
ncbi:hypothetical protein D3C85_1101380 [compost metagenome]